MREGTLLHIQIRILTMRPVPVAKTQLISISLCGYAWPDPSSVIVSES